MFIAVVVWVVVDVLARVDTPKLEVPNVFEHGVYTDRTTRNGSFLINPLGVCVCVCVHVCLGPLTVSCIEVVLFRTEPVLIP